MKGGIKDMDEKKQFNKKKLIMFGFFGLFALALVSAVAYYAFFTVTLNVDQPISVNGIDNQVIDCEAPAEGVNKCMSEQVVRIDNDADEDRTVTVSAVGDMVISYVGILELTKKDTTTWLPSVDQNDKIELTYTVVGDTFEFTGVPGGYTLIYYKDQVVGLEGRLENPQPAIIVTSDIGSLAHSDDSNIDELANYAQEPDFYAHAKGAKLWVVQTSDINAGVLNWANMDNYYYETDLIWYSDSVDTLTVPANSFIEFYPQVEVDKYASDGTHTIDITIA